MKPLVIATMLILSGLLSRSQERIIKTSVPCSDDVLYKTPGKWFKSMDVWQVDHIAFNSSQQQEARNRIDQIHAMVQGLYPEPAGLDVAWHRVLGYSTFGDRVTYVRKDEFSLDRRTLVEKPVAPLGYVAGFFRHFCNPNDPHQVLPGYPGETGTWLNIHSNAFGGFAEEYFGNEDTLTINGYPVYLRPPLKQRFDTYQVFYSKGNVDNPETTPQRFVLVHRKGELPYLPVTRREYLEKCIAHLSKSQEKTIRDFEQMPLNSAGEQETRKEQIAELKKSMESALTRYRIELKETTGQGLLDFPAIIPVTVYNTDEYVPIFVEENRGFMIIRVNPGYIRANLPKYVPQFFTMWWNWNEFQSQADVGRLIEEAFPFAALNAMLDK